MKNAPWQEFYDDLSGERLNSEMVIEARKEEMIEVNKHNVYKKAPLTKCYDATGKAPIGTRWVDVNKGDSAHPEYRSRLVAQEINTDTREYLFAAPPPPLGIRYWLKGETPPFGLECIGLICIGLDCVGLDLHCIGLECIGLDCIGLDCIA